MPSQSKRARKLQRWVNIYPPYLGAGVRVTHISDDFRDVEVEMPLRFYNRNYVGTHFGGSLYSMVDPFYMLMLINILGPGLHCLGQSRHHPIQEARQRRNEGDVPADAKRRSLKSAPPPTRSPKSSRNFRC